MKSITQAFTRRRRYDDLSVSIQEHIAEKIEELVESGMPRGDAEQAARREFGNMMLIEQRSREVWQWPALESILADLKFTLRRVRKSPGFAVTVLLTLAIGIGANTAVFSVINSVLINPLPYPGSDRLVALWLGAPGAGGLSNFQDGLRLSPSMYFTFREHNRTFDSLGIWSTDTANVTGLAQPEQVHVASVSDGILEALAIPAAAGRLLSSVDQDPHGAKTVMLGYGYWQRRFGGERSALGRSIVIDGETREIVGVMPRGFRLVDRDFDLLTPFAFDRSHLKLSPFGYQGLGRLKPGVTPRQANADLSRMLPIWMDSFSNGPGTNPHFYEGWHITPALHSLKQEVVGNVVTVLWVVMTTIGLVLLIACTNVANLMLVRADARRHELSIRAALGAGRARIAREILIESVLLGLLGGVFGGGAAFAGLRLLTAIGPANLPRLSEIALDARSLAFTFLVSVLSSLFFGSIPAWKYARKSSILGTGGSARTASASRERHRSRNVLVVAQVAMAMVLLVSAMLMIRTFQRLRTVDPGFADAQHLQTMRISIPEMMVTNPQMVTRIENDILQSLQSIPGVTSVGFGVGVPMEGVEPNWDQIRVEGKSYKRDDPPIRLYNYVSPGFLQTLGTRIVAGRDFTWNEIYGFRQEVIVSENFARESWGSPAAAIGKRIRQFEDLPWQEVVGVAQDVRFEGGDQVAPAIVYWPAMINSPYVARTIDASRNVCFVIHTDRAGTQGLLNQIQQAVWSVNASLPVASVRTMQEIYGKSMARTSFTLVMLGIAASMALTLGTIGIYGVISYAVSQRTREIGIRLALGAQKRELRWMFVRSALVLTSIGIAIGLGAGAALTQLMKSLLFGVSPIDPITYVAIPVLLAACAVLASYLPARRAAAVDPVEALRAE
jgi:putative ABC transport system permease protein